MQNPDVCILMATCDGAEFLERQIASFERQTCRNWILVASDDGSSDATPDILRDCQMRLGPERVILHDGPRQGFAQNFLSLLRRAPTAEFYAFSDQDDIWLDQHLAASIACHRTHAIDLPVISSTRTVLIDAGEKRLGLSTLYRRAPSFQNALLQNIGGGNTMVLNQRARDLLLKIPEPARIVSHDWIAYMLVTGCGGAFSYLTQPGVMYRQHGANQVGMNGTIRARIARLQALFNGRLRDWISRNVETLDLFSPHFTEANRITYERFKTARAKRGALGRIRSWLASGVRRQTTIEDIAVMLALAAKRV